MQILDTPSYSLGQAIEYKLYGRSGNASHYVELPSSPNQTSALFRNGDSSMIYIDGDALKTLRPNEQFVWSGSGYSGLTWLESDTPPTESEINT